MYCAPVLLGSSPRPSKIDWHVVAETPTNDCSVWCGIPRFPCGALALDGEFFGCSPFVATFHGLTHAFLPPGPDERLAHPPGRFSEECLSTLQFANRCRSVHNNPRVNKVDAGATADSRKLKKLQDEIQALRSGATRATRHGCCSNSLCRGLGRAATAVSPESKAPARVPPSIARPVLVDTVGRFCAELISSEVAQAVLYAHDIPLPEPRNPISNSPISEGCGWGMATEAVA